MEMLIVFQNPEFRCHLIQLAQLQKHHVATQGQPARASQQRLLPAQILMETHCKAFTFLVSESSESEGILVDTWKMISTVEVA